MKQVIVVNRALDLPKGKLAAQVAHAAVGAFVVASPEVQQVWQQIGMPKVVLKDADEETLRRLLNAARHNHIAAVLIRDAGRAVVPADTITCLGLGPAPVAEIDQLTGELKLL
jgi:peptidyl-tRNA hydrolase